jgi:hypothetical protein
MGNRFINKKWLAGLLMAVSLTGCGDDGGKASTDTIGGACTGNDCVSLSGPSSGTPLAAGDLTSASSYVILAKTAITTTGATKITGNLGLSPAAASLISGFGLVADSTNVFSTSSLVTGKIYASDYAPPTPSNLTSAVANMQLALTNANGMAPAGGGLTTACPGVGSLGGLTITPGVYNCTSTLLIPPGTNVTLKGSGVYVLKTSAGITQSADTQVILSDGAQAKNVFWVAGGVVDIGSNATMQGVVLTQSNINVKTGAKVNGRLLAQTAVTLDASTVVVP